MCILKSIRNYRNTVNNNLNSELSIQFYVEEGTLDLNIKGKVIATGKEEKGIPDRRSCSGEHGALWEHYVVELKLEHHGNEHKRS